MVRVDGVFLKTSKVFLETVGAFVVKAVTVVTDAMVAVEVWGGPSIGYTDDVGATLPSQSGLTAGRGN